MKRKRTNKKIDIDKVNFRFVPILVIAVVLLLSIGYSALETNIFMELTAKFVPVTDIRITGIKPSSATEGAYSSSEKYVKDNVSVDVYLPNSDSEVLYNIEITNFEEPIAGILSISEENSSVDAEIIDYDFGDPLCDNDNKCNLGAIANITLKIKYADGVYENLTEESDKNYNVSIDFDFRGFATIAYTNLSSSGLPTTIMEGANISIDLSSKNLMDVFVTSGASILEEGTNYSYTNGVLTINSVVGSINVAGIVEEVNEPDLYSGDLTPVVYNGSNWTVADTNSSWYNYSNGNWANAVILGYTKDENEQDVRITKSVGDTVIVDGSDVNCEVLGMFVWIPRYSYTIKYDSTLEGNYGVLVSDINASSVSSETPGAVDIRFISTESKEVHSASYTDTPKNFATHPAFTISSGGSTVELSGIWVAKFANSNDGNKELIVPNVVMNKQTMADNVTSASSFNSILNNSDSHLLKNNEWEAVSLLSQSIYGKYGNQSYSNSLKEVYFNNSILYYTGRSSGFVSGSLDSEAIYGSQQEILTNNYGFYTYDGYLLDYNANTKSVSNDMSTVASTTGNIYGVYDMNSMCSEVVSTYSLLDLDSKYYDTKATSSCISGICYEGLSSTKAWYDDHFVNSISTSIVVRNNANVNDNVENGMFAFSEGDSSTLYCYRSAIFED